MVINYGISLHVMARKSFVLLVVWNLLNGLSCARGRFISVEFRPRKLR